ncbi:MAG: MgtC/SapB family protein [Dehalococcoidia bacterium]
MSNGDQLEIVARVALALLLGSLIGLEREYRGHEAGIRTSALVAAAAAAFAEVSFIQGDDRIAAGVVQGIGFLGAGLIFQRHRGVSGVTTAATIWMVASIGLLVASRLWLTSIVLTAVIIGLLELVPVSNWVYRHGRHHSVARHPPVSENDPPPDTGGDA